MKTNVFITGKNIFGTVNEVCAHDFAEPMPARSCVTVMALPNEAPVEIEFVAFSGRAYNLLYKIEVLALRRQNKWDYSP